MALIASRSAFCASRIRNRGSIKRPSPPLPPSPPPEEHPYRPAAILALQQQEGTGVVDLQWIEGGGVATPRGFRAGGVYAGIRTYGEEPRFDVGVLVSDFPCAVGGIFT